MFHCPTSNRIRSSRSQQRAHQRIRQPVAGSAWILFLSLINVLVLNHTPDWVRARVLAISTLVFQGAVAVGSAAWGALRMSHAQREFARIAELFEHRLVELSPHKAGHRNRRGIRL